MVLVCGLIRFKYVTNILIQLVSRYLPSFKKFCQKKKKKQLLIHEYYKHYYTLL